ncbi:MAG: Transcriptional regulator, AcrR family [Firmicutes bacterium]|nr:Transcriptional regulator, AcrR family [Bacillota bacterium]MDI6705375.1 TetR/AcrR family transcriptional regulator [Bacillota bacterium]
MAKKLTKRQQKSEENKRKIVNCAMRLFAEHGYDNVSVDDIAKAANSSKGSFYNYFRSKDELFVFYRQALDAQCVDFYEKLLQDPAYAKHNGLQKFYLMSMFALQTMSSNGDEFARISDMRLFKDEVGFYVPTPARDNYHRIFPNLINMGKADGSIRKDLSTDEIVDSLYLYFNGIMYDWEVSKGSFNITEKYAYMIEFFCYSIAEQLG